MTKEPIPSKLDFKGVVNELGLRARLIEENLAAERRNKPLKIIDTHYWLKIPLEWVICFWDEGQWRSIRTRESFWGFVCDLPKEVRAVHVFRSTGDHYRHYSRVFDFFKEEIWDITLFTQDDRKALFKLLKRAMRQKRTQKRAA